MYLGPQPIDTSCKYYTQHRRCDIYDPMLLGSAERIEFRQCDLDKNGPPMHLVKTRDKLIHAYFIDRES